MSWADNAPILERAVACSGSQHTLRWSAGGLVLVDHPDRDAEVALVAFGGEEPPCLTLAHLWDEGVADGGFLAEWAHGELDRARRWWLDMALERMRSEGFHEFLRDLPFPRARRMGEFLAAFDDEWLDRAAAEVAARLDGPEAATCDRAPWLIDNAVVRRVRRAFVSAVGGRQLALGAAALVPVRVQVLPGGAEPTVHGLLDGRASWAEITVGRRWLADVWAGGTAVVDGELVLAVDHETGTRQSVTWRNGHAELTTRH